MTQETYNQLVAVALEVEGLTMLLANREGDAPAAVVPLLLEKLDLMKSMLEEGAAAAPIEPIATIATVEDFAPAPHDFTPSPSTDANAEAMARATELETIEDALPQASPATELKVEQRLARDHARDLRRAFSLNDRFMYRRELFGNSDARFDEALEAIMDMNTYAEAEEYVYTDLCLDRDLTPVKEFMAIVAAHFA